MLIQVKRHGMIFLKIFNLPFLINQLALLILEGLLGNNPVIVEPLTFLLEVGQEFLFLLEACIKSSELFAQVESVLLGLDVLDFLGLVDALLLDFYF